MTLGVGGISSTPLASGLGVFPNESNLTLLATLKGYLDPAVPGNAADDMLSGLINRASALICAATNTPTIFDSGTDITERRNGNGRDLMVTTVNPINSVSSISIVSQWGCATAQPTTIPASDGSTPGYLFDSERIYLIGGYIFTKGAQNVTLVYQGGALIDSPVQQMLEQACLVTCALWWKRRAHVDQTSMAAPNGMGSIGFSQADLPKEAWTAINQIKRVVPVLP